MAISPHAALQQLLPLCHEAERRCGDQGGALGEFTVEVLREVLQEWFRVRRKPTAATVRGWLSVLEEKRVVENMGSDVYEISLLYRAAKAKKK